MAGPYDLAGVGLQAIAQPAALVVTTTARGLKATQGKANPPNLYNVGLLSWGDADAWYRVEAIGVSPQRFLLPAGCTQLGYSLIAGSSIHVVEVPTAPPLARSLNPWDRHPLAIPLAYQSLGVSGHASTQRWTYTVPAGRLALVTDLELDWFQSQAGSSRQWATSWVWLAPAAAAPNYALQCNVFTQNVGDQRQAFGSGQIVLSAGDNIACYTGYPGNGFLQLAASMVATEFDA